jgi:hypothetical protein
MIFTTEKEELPVIDVTSYDGIHLIVFDFVEVETRTNYDGTGFLHKTFGKPVYGFKEKRMPLLEPVLIKTDDPELRGDFIDFSFLKLWKWT